MDGSRFEPDKRLSTAGSTISAWYSPTSTVPEKRVKKVESMRVFPNARSSIAVKVLMPPWNTVTIVNVTMIHLTTQFAH